MRPPAVVTRHVTVYSVPASPPLSQMVAVVVVFVAAVWVMPVGTVHTTDEMVSVVNHAAQLIG
jgi:hypothetical protein